MASFLYSNIPDWETDIDKDLVNFYNKYYDDNGDLPKRIRRLNISSSSLCNVEYIYLLMIVVLVIKLTLQFFNNMSIQKT